MDDRHPAAGGPPEDFVPMRLRLHPGHHAIDLTRPDVLLGRHTEADLRMPLPDVSRRHCRFVFADGHWQVFDLNSLNGVFINGERLQEATLCPGDEVRIGGLTFLVEIAAAPVGPSPTPADKASASVLKSIADVLPGPGSEKRRAS